MTSPNEGKLIGPNFSRRLAHVLPWAEQQMGEDEIPQPRTPQVITPNTTGDAMGGYVAVTEENTLDGTSTTLYYARAMLGGHNLVRLYDGTRWRIREIDFDDAMPSVTNDGLSANTWYLAFLSWDDEQKKVILTVEYVNSTVCDGVVVHESDSTKRWVALVYTNSSGEFESNPDKRFVVNGYNQVALPLEATVNTGTGLDDTDDIKIVNGGGWWQGFLVQLDFHARIDASAAPTVLVARLYTGELWASKAYGPAITLTDHAVDTMTYGLSLSYSNRLNTTFSGLETYNVRFTGGANCDLIEGTFTGVLYG